ncbi:MAG: cation:proton antiporter [bacterium]
MSPAYIIGALLSNQLINDKEISKRIRVTTVSILSPFYFLKAGILVKFKVVINCLNIMLILFLSKVLSKFLGLYPLAYFMRFKNKANIYNTLMMSTGLTFGTISALYGLNHGIIDESRYSLIVTAVVLSVLIPTIIAQIFFIPKGNEAFNFKKEKK